MKPNKIYCGNAFRIMKKLKSRSIDLILTDPPYGTNYKKVIGDESIKTYLRFLELSYRVMKYDTFLIAYCYPLYVPEIIEKARQAGLMYRWIGFNYYPNMFKQKPQPLGFNRYDMFLIFSKGKAKKNGCIKDTIHILMDKANAKTRKYGHPHQKPEKCAEKIIKAASKEGDVILDPFCGSGVFMVTAVKMNRRYIGIDISRKYCNITKKRIKDYEK